MFEWLSYGDWCDVRIVCGPSVFNAHRTVLASSSLFLKNLLLSCPTETSPIFIFLPEIEAEVMLSVLYYIYNGEVSLPEVELKKFIDIISTLRIRIDNQSASLIKEKVGNFIEDYNHKYTLNSKDMEQENYVKLYKRVNTNQSSSICIKDSETNGYENIQPNKFNIEVSKLNDTGRQRQNYLHASFNEVYLRNGNVNGQARCVPAIINEHYLHTSSLTNAEDDFNNSDNTSKDITLNKLSKETLHHEETNGHNEIESSTKGNGSYVEYSQTTNEIHKTCTNNETSPVNLQCNLNRNNIEMKYVLNKVLHNPWRSKLSAFYKPFRRKNIEEPENLVKNDINDSNNNLNIGNEEKYHQSISKDKTDICKSDDKIPNEEKEPSTSVKEKFKCSICDEVFQDEISLTSHSNTHLSNGRYSCTECSKSFSQLRNFKYHMSVHKGTREFAATCTVCGKYFNDRGYLSSHMKIHKNRKEYKCSLCPKSFNQRVAYNMHMRIHTGVKPHVCSECGKAFSRKMLLKQHQRTHSGERPYQCSHCEKRFADRSNMTLHLRLHTGVKPFSCSYCSKSFTKKHHLKSHLNFHTGDKPYSCPQCSMSFTQSSNMRTHLKKCSVNTKNKTEV